MAKLDIQADHHCKTSLTTLGNTLAAKERNTTGTDLVIQGLYHVLGAVEGSMETDVETHLHQLSAE